MLPSRTKGSGSAKRARRKRILRAKRKIWRRRLTIKEREKEGGPEAGVYNVVFHEKLVL
jgi:hypothetical protein